MAEHFEVSVRTVERDLSALGQAGVPLATKQGRGGGYALDRSMDRDQWHRLLAEAVDFARKNLAE